MTESTTKPNRPLYKHELYFAYGSNLNKAQFFRRCPNARCFGRFTMPDWRLVFDRVADIVPAPGEAVEGALYEITRKCERALDRYEGFPHLYVKEKFKVIYTGQRGRRIERDAMVYVMWSESLCQPSDFYANTIRTGFDDWGIPHDTLDAALAEVRREAA